MKRKCLLARAFSRSRQCRVRAAGTVGGKAPVGCKAASDEGNYTTKRKCVLAQTFSRGRQWHIVRLSAARAAQPPILAAWHHVTIIPRSENVCLQGHFREAVNDAAARMRGQGIRPDVLPSGKTTAYIIPPLYEQIKFFMVGAPRGPRTTGKISS